MDLSVYVRFIVALAFVLSLIGLIYWCLRRFGLNRLMGDNSTGNRLEIIETKRINTKFQLVLVQRDAVAHLILLGQDTGVLIETLLENKQQQKEVDTISKRKDLDEVFEKKEVERGI